MLNHLVYIQYACMKQSKVVYSLNHDITVSFTLWLRIAKIGSRHGRSTNGIIDLYITNCSLEHFKWLNRQNATLGSGIRHHCGVIIWGEEWVTSQSLVSHWSNTRWSNVEPHNFGCGWKFSTDKNLKMALGVNYFSLFFFIDPLTVKVGVIWA